MPDTKLREVAEVVRDAGGKIVGRTRLQKVAYLAELAGLGCGFRFEYRHYGPFSEDLADAVRTAKAFGLILEEEKKANWGGVYSVFQVSHHAGEPADATRCRFLQEAAQVDSVELELAATAAYLYTVERHNDPWLETARRKPEKVSDGRLERAREAYRKLCLLETPKRLPELAR